MRKRNWTITLLSVALVVASWSCATIATVEQEASPMGLWDLECLDGDGTRWFATLVLSNDGNDTLAGRADWLGDNGASGREHISGTYDPRSRTITFHGTHMEYGDRIVQCEYSATLSSSGNHLDHGEMFREGVTMRGTWKASRIRIQDA